MNRYLFAVICLLLAGCTFKKGHTPVRAMYFWKTDFSLNDEEKAFVRDHKIERLYVKYMDIDWGEKTQEGIPVSLTNLPEFAEYDTAMSKMVRTDNIVPVIYITNNTFQHTDSNHARLLAEKTNALLGRMWQQQVKHIFTQRRYNEVQFDCDWSVGTKDKFFYFLQCFKLLPGNEKLKLSATIRLHQYKYPEKTGVPPVQEGVLMMYNMGKVQDINTGNSIFDERTTLAYLRKGSPYPLPLNIALPAYSWAVVYRNGHIINLLQTVDVSPETDTTSFLPQGDNKYVLVKDTYINGRYYRYGDVLKFEEVSDSLLQTAGKTSAKFVDEPGSIILFSLNAAQLKKYKYETVENVFTAK